MQMIQEHVKNLKNVKVDCFDGMLVDYLKNKRLTSYCEVFGPYLILNMNIKGALTNRALNKKVETVFVMTSEQYSFLNSTLIKEAVSLGGSVCQFVPADVERRLIQKNLSIYMERTLNDIKRLCYR